MAKVIREIKIPKPCKWCNLWHYCLHTVGIAIYADERSPDCPLKIEEEVCNENN